MRLTRVIVIGLIGGLGGCEIAFPSSPYDEYTFEEPLEQTAQYPYSALTRPCLISRIFVAWWWPRFHVCIKGTTLSNSLFVRALNDL